MARFGLAALLSLGCAAEQRPADRSTVEVGLDGATAAASEAPRGSRSGDPAGDAAATSEPSGPPSGSAEAPPPPAPVPAPPMSLLSTDGAAALTVVNAVDARAEADATARAARGADTIVGKGAVACSPDGRVAAGGTSHAVSCETLCVCFQKNEDRAYPDDGNCHKFATHKQCLAHCQANWNTPASLCCRAFRCTNALKDRLDVPGFPATLPGASGAEQHHQRCNAAYHGTACEMNPAYP